MPNAKASKSGKYKTRDPNLRPIGNYLHLPLCEALIHFDSIKMEIAKSRDNILNEWSMRTKFAIKLKTIVIQ